MSKKNKRKIFNASSLPQRYFGLHMAEGCAHYGEEDPPKTIMLKESMLKQMDKSFEGRPLFVNHQDVDDVTAVEEMADGYVIKSFYNSADGKHWAEFIAVSDEALKAIKAGWQLSNAYDVLQLGDSGQWHGIAYDAEVVSGEYDHLALTPSPRYKESMILTPEEFKIYNEQKKTELESYQNSITKKTGVKSMLSFFKKDKVENSADLENMSVLLPKSKKEIEISKLVNMADEQEQNADKPKFASASDMVKVNGEDMKIEDLVNKYEDMAKKQENEEEDDKTENEDGEEDDKTENEDGEEDKPKNKNSSEQNAGKPKGKQKVENNSGNGDNEDESESDLTEYEKIMNADKNNTSEEEVFLDLDGVSRGKARYGSK